MADVARRCPSLKMLAHTVGHQKFGILGPAVAALGEADFLFAEGLAVGGAGILLVRGAKPDMAIDDDQGRRIVACLEFSIACAKRSVSLTSPTRCTFQP